MPLVLINILSPFPFSTTLVSPVTIYTPAFWQAVLIDTNTSQNSSIRKPSSSIKLKDKYLGIAPHIARSFTVPFTASSPILPPGKNMGDTTKLSVVKAQLPVKFKKAPSCFSFKKALFKISNTPLSSNLRVSKPPPPCPNVITSKSSTGMGH